MIEGVLGQAGREGAIPLSAIEPSPRDTLLQMTNAFRASQAIYVAATLGIADLLEDGPKSVDELAQATGTHAPTLHRLLRALASVGVFTEQPNGQFGSTPMAEYLRTNGPRSLRAWAMQIGQEYGWRSWGHLLHSVRTGEPAFPELYGTTAWEYRAAHPAEEAVFNAAMTALSSGVVEAIVQSYDFSGIDVLMDVGGGEGVLLAAILAANPALRGILFDQPQVLTGAHDLLERAGVADRCEVVSGSFFESVPRGADAHLLKSVVHDWHDVTTVKILRACRAAISDTGKLLVVEPIIQAGNEPDPAKFSDLNMLVMLGGQERTADDFERLYAEAGFRVTDIIYTGTSMAIIEGVPV
jgi:O-methyltransferase domain/Dimerisation domain